MFPLCTEQTSRSQELPSHETIDDLLMKAYSNCTFGTAQLPLDILKYIYDLNATGNLVKQEPAKHSIQLGRTCSFWYTLSQLGAPGEALRLAKYLAPLEDKALRKIWKKKLAQEFTFGGQQRPQTVGEIKKWLENPDNAKQIEKITVLNLSGLGLQAIPPHITVFSNLQMLFLQNNKIEVIPEAIGNLRDLHTLSLDNNKIKVIPEAIGNLINLEELYLQNNEIEMIPEAIGKLINLRDLNLQDNEIAVIPEAIGNLVNLEELALDNNAIAVIPEEIGTLIKLRHLNLQKNEIEVIPEAIGNLVDLVELKLKNNPIKEFPTKTLGKLVNLEVFAIHGNPLLSNADNDELLIIDWHEELMHVFSRINVKGN